MIEFGKLVFNEAEKIIKKRRIAVIILILLVLIPIFLYAQNQQTKETEKRMGTDDWRVVLQQRIVEGQNRLSSTGISEEWKHYLSIQVKQQQYYLEHDINPSSPGAPTFVREFLKQGIGMFIPLLVMIVAIDIISGERSDGTIKLLLTRPVKRWKILLSKYVTLLLFISLIVLIVIAMAYLLAGIFFNFSGWKLPIATGFEYTNGNLITDSIRLIPQWQYILMSAGLVWYVSVIVGTIAFMVSILIRNTPGGMGVMFASLIAGAILKGFATAWDGAKYIYSVNMELIDYLSGSMPMIDGMTLPFSLSVLAIWGLGALLVSFIVFTRQDMLS
jgi:ABC-2 type transport system permease protein